MSPDELEYQISQYLDGTLSTDETTLLEDRLGRDVSARSLLAEYASLNGQLKQADPLPAMDWDALATRISSAVAGQEAPAQSYRMPAWARNTTRVAVAACLLVAGWVGFRMMSSDAPVGPGSPVVIVEPKARPTVVIVDVAPDAPALARPTGAPAAIQVAVGPAPAIADEPALTRYADGFVTRPSRAVIASAVRLVEDAPSTPY